MSLTVIKEGNMLRIVEASAEVPDGTRLVLFTEQEMVARRDGIDPLDAAQLDSVFREDDEDWGDSLKPILLQP